MALVTIQRSPTPSDTPEETSEDDADSSTAGGTAISRQPSRNRSGSECYFAVKGAAIALPQNDCIVSTSSSNSASGEIQHHLEEMYKLLRPQDRLKHVVRLESVLGGNVRYLAIIGTQGLQDTPESAILGVDYDSDQATLGLALPVWTTTHIALIGDGAISVKSNDNSHVFKPVSVQVMWSLFQALHREHSIAAHNLHIPGGMTHTWIQYYETRINSTEPRIHEWYYTFSDEAELKADGIEMHREKPPEQIAMEKRIRAELRDIMQSVDLNDVTSLELRNRLKSTMPDFDLDGYKDFIEREMLVILGQMDCPSQIFPYLFLGTEWNASNYEELKKNKVGYILNVTKEVDNFFPKQFHYKKVAVSDEESAELLKHWDSTHRFILCAKENNKAVLVHCKKGISRSSSTVIAHAMKNEGMTLGEALAFVLEKRNCIRPNQGFLKQLNIYEGILEANRHRNLPHLSRCIINSLTPSPADRSVMMTVAPQAAASDEVNDADTALDSIFPCSTIDDTTTLAMADPAVPSARSGGRVKQLPYTNVSMSGSPVAAPDQAGGVAQSPREGFGAGDVDVPWDDDDDDDDDDSHGYETGLEPAVTLLPLATPAIAGGGAHLVAEQFDQDSGEDCLDTLISVAPMPSGCSDSSSHQQWPTGSSIARVNSSPASQKPTLPTSVVLAPEPYPQNQIMTMMMTSSSEPIPDITTDSVLPLINPKLACSEALPHARPCFVINDGATVLNVRSDGSLMATSGLDDDLPSFATPPAQQPPPHRGAITGEESGIPYGQSVASRDVGAVASPLQCNQAGTVERQQAHVDMTADYHEAVFFRRPAVRPQLVQRHCKGASDDITLRDMQMTLLRRSCSFSSHSPSSSADSFSLNSSCNSCSSGEELETGEHSKKHDETKCASKSSPNHVKSASKRRRNSHCSSGDSGVTDITSRDSGGLPLSCGGQPPPPPPPPPSRPSDDGTTGATDTTTIDDSLQVDLDSATLMLTSSSSVSLSSSRAIPKPRPRSLAEPSGSNEAVSLKSDPRTRSSLSAAPVLQENPPAKNDIKVTPGQVKRMTEKLNQLGTSVGNDLGANEAPSSDDSPRGSVSISEPAVKSIKQSPVKPDRKSKSVEVVAVAAKQPQDPSLKAVSHKRPKIKSGSGPVSTFLERIRSWKDSTGDSGVTVISRSSASSPRSQCGDGRTTSLAVSSDNNPQARLSSTRCRLTSSSVSSSSSSSRTTLKPRPRSLAEPSGSNFTVILKPGPDMDSSLSVAPAGAQQNPPKGDIKVTPGQVKRMTEKLNLLGTSSCNDPLANDAPSSDNSPRDFLSVRGPGKSLKQRPVKQVRKSKSFEVMAVSSREQQDPSLKSAGHKRPKVKSGSGPVSTLLERFRSWKDSTGDSGVATDITSRDNKSRGPPVSKRSDGSMSTTGIIIDSSEDYLQMRIDTAPTSTLISPPSSSFRPIPNPRPRSLAEPPNDLSETVSLKPEPGTESSTSDAPLLQHKTDIKVTPGQVKRMTEKLNLLGTSTSNDAMAIDAPSSDNSPRNSLSVSEPTKSQKQSPVEQDRKSKSFDNVVFEDRQKCHERRHQSDIVDETEAKFTATRKAPVDFKHSLQGYP